METAGLPERAQTTYQKEKQSLSLDSTPDKRAVTQKNRKKSVSFMSPDNNISQSKFSQAERITGEIIQDTLK